LIQPHEILHHLTVKLANCPIANGPLAKLRGISWTDLWKTCPSKFYEYLQFFSKSRHESDGFMKNSSRTEQFIFFNFFQKYREKEIWRMTRNLKFRKKILDEFSRMSQQGFKVAPYFDPKWRWNFGSELSSSFLSDSLKLRRNCEMEFSARYFCYRG